MTGQDRFAGYEDSGARVAVELVNASELGGDRGTGASPHAALTSLARILADDPPSLEQLGAGDVTGFAMLAARLRAVFADLDDGDVDAAARRLNELLAAHPAHPHLAKEHGRWRLHHHPADLALVPMWTAICAEALARAIGAGDAGRLGTCAASDCGRVFLDGSKNASRRFCSTTCQNRIKAAAFRRRHAVS